MKRKDKHIGDIYVSDQGFTVRILKWESRERIKVEFVETGEKRWTDYWTLKNGKIYPDLYKYPPKGECTIKQAAILGFGIVSLAVALIGGLIYWLCI